VPGAAPVASDSGRWVPAVARTWVNVRRVASRDGEVVGVIKPASRAWLELGRAGWRRVRAQDVRGWADPRLFEADSVARRGG
jgi:SH3-like domain-containing protein